MGFATTREQRRELARENAKRTRELQLVPRHEWPYEPDGLRRVWRSRYFLVQEHEANDPALVRLSVIRTSLEPIGGRWIGDIAWDDLQRIKCECGYAQHDAVEVYPNAIDVVNVENMRHLWVMRNPLSFVWRNTDERVHEAETRKPSKGAGMEDGQ